MKTETFLFELGTAELPPKALDQMAEAFKENVLEKLNTAQLSFEKSELFYTPRRLALKIHGLQVEQPEQHIERKGPAYRAAFDEQGQPTQALLGFLKSADADLSEVETFDTPKGQWAVVKKTIAGKAAQELLPDIILEALKKLPIPKLMRWGEGAHSFVRPVYWVLALLGDQVIPMTLFGQNAHNCTYGHRFHHPQPIAIKQAEHYPEILKQQGYVIACAKTRRQMISHQIEEICHNLGANAVTDAALLKEVANIVEWPVALLCRFDKRFLNVPKEALVSSMQGHQKCFPVVDKAGHLESYFITVSNIESVHPQSVIKGNEKVMHARLSDAAFFFETDLKKPLFAHCEALKRVTFQAKLGTLWDKTERVKHLAAFMATQLTIETTACVRAAELSKCDLMTEMVMEFPEVQGIMGQVYALKSGETEQVASALYEQYLPRFAGDVLPTSVAGRILALADKIDTLVGIFGINQKPTGTKDPFALRRAMVGVIRILIESSLDLDISFVFDKALSLYQTSLAKPLTNQAVLADVQAFCFERLKNYYHEQGIGSDLFEAVYQKGIVNLADFNIRIHALQAFRTLPEAQSLCAANKRVSNILQKNKQEVAGDVKPTLFDSPYESSLYETLQAITENINQQMKHKQYAEVLKELATLKTAIDNFFDHVMVMCEQTDIRANRLALLAKLQEKLSLVGEIGCLN